MVPWTALVLALMLAGCVRAGRPPLLLGKPIQSKVAVLVRVSDEASKLDDFGATAELVETVMAGLEERGVRADLYARDDDHPPSPRIEIWVQKWDPGDERLRGLGASTIVGGALARVPLVTLGGSIAVSVAAGEYAVLCRVYREGEDKPGLEYLHEGVITTLTGSSLSNGASVGNAILRHALVAPETPSEKYVSDYQ